MGDAHFAFLEHVGLRTGIRGRGGGARFLFSFFLLPAEAGLRKTQNRGIGSLAVPDWISIPWRQRYWSRLSRQSSAHGDPRSWHRPQLATAFPDTMTPGETRRGNLRFRPRHTIRRLSGPEYTENMLRVVQAMQGDYEEGSASRAAMIAPPVLSLSSALGAKILCWMQCGRFGSGASNCWKRTGTRPEKWRRAGVFICAELVAVTLLRFRRGLLAIEPELRCAATRNRRCAHGQPSGMISAVCGTLSGGERRGIATPCVAQVRDTGLTPNFFLHW